MTPEIITRSFTSDNFVFDDVFFNNKYKIKGIKDKSISKTVIDIGAHCGYFAFTALSLGIKKIYAFEPYIDNFSVLLKNCYNRYFPNRVTPYQLGVYPSPSSGILAKFSNPELINGVYFDLANVGIVTKPNENYYACHCHNLDTILETYCFDEHINILKINIGYAEKEILRESILLNTNIDSICGEIEVNNEAELIAFKKEMGIKGFVNFFSLPIKDKPRVRFWASKLDLNDNFVIDKV